MGSLMKRGWALPTATFIIACSEPPRPLPPSNPLPPNSFSFGVFGDAPYEPSEQPRFRRVLDDINNSDIQWLVHIGDILWYPCSDSAYSNRLAAMNSVDRAVVYTPGDNEWADCHTNQEGGYDPLDRLASVRRIFFARPNQSLGRKPIALESQANDPAFAEFPENARWVHSGFVFVTIHVVGSSDAGEPFRGRTAANDAENARRRRAAIAWLDAAFSKARETSARGVVIAAHADMGLESASGSGKAYAEFVGRVKKHVDAFRGPVLLIHGDSHVQRVDHPLVDQTGQPYPNFTRLETYGAPDIGWIRVVVDTVSGQVSSYEPRLMR